MRPSRPIGRAAGRPETPVEGNTTVKQFCRRVLTFAFVCGCGWSLADDPAVPADSVPQPPPAEAPLLDVEHARERAELMHEIYLSTLDAMHERYFHADRAVVPARAMEDVFRDMEAKTHSQARWISASFTPMNLDHEPKTDFEQMAAKQLSKGTEFTEVIEAGYYRRAGSVPLNGGCISCHSGKFGGTSPAKRFAGLVISVPVKPGSTLESASRAPAE